VRPSLALLAPIAPAATGNGLSMRVDLFARAAAAAFDVHGVVVPVAGKGPAASTMGATTVPLPNAARLRREVPRLLTQQVWRDRLAAATPLPDRALMAPALLAADVAALVPAGSALHVTRSYLAPLGLATAERIGASSATLDLDDDDETFALAAGDPEDAAAWHRLVATFARSYDGVCAASPVEAQALAARHGFACTPVPNAVALPPRASRRPVPGRVLFIGNMLYPPNQEAAAVLTDEVEPLLPEGVSVRVVGPGSKEGYIPALAPVYAEASVFVAPLRAGAGTRIKLLEAFAHRVPVVTTAIGAAGLDVTDGEHLLLGDSPAELAAACTRVLEDPALGEALAARAADLVRDSYSFDAVAPVVRRFLRPDTTST
jgi:glycosyltransferase involved in cell wall biosynthesis